MAKSKVKIIDSILQEITRFSMTDDNALVVAQEFISDKIDTYRATLLETYSLSKQFINSAYQVINCLKPECLGVSCVVEGITLTSSTDIWVVEVPEILDIRDSIKYFGPYDMSYNYPQTDITSVSVGFRRWYGREEGAYAKVGNKIYFRKKDRALQFSLIAIFASPSGVCGFSDETDYPMPKKLEAQLELLIKKDLFTILSIPLDVINDAQDISQKKVRQNEQSNT
jgi:hypothetical protein